MESITILYHIAPQAAAVVLLLFLAVSRLLGTHTKHQDAGGTRLRGPSSKSEISVLSSSYERPRPDRQENSAQIDAEQLNLLKDMYFKLHNMEEHYEVLPAARALLVQMFSETLSEAIEEAGSGILALTEYTPDDLARHLRAVEVCTGQEWEDYLARRRSGSPRELFRDFDSAKSWLEQSAPARCVDGAWLGHINRVTTPFALRPITKDAWQVLSEELGDGDVKKNHVFVYRELLEAVGSRLPPSHDIDFIHPRHGLNHVGAWRAGVSQLLISLFPHDFLPEILGFNLHFEGITLTTLKTAHELRELKIDPRYFVLHVTIDNSDSGHAAMALQAVVKYLDYVKATRQTEDAVQQAWKRVQAGYVLSERCPFSPLPSAPSLANRKRLSFRNDLAKQVAATFAAKAVAAEKLHCGSRVRIGRRTLVEWLEPGSIRNKQWQIDFLEDLANCRPWVKRGDADNSQLIRELCWGGKMFGAFTHKEVETVKRWIETLSNDPRIDLHSDMYWSFTGRTDPVSRHATRLIAGEARDDIRSCYPVYSGSPRPALFDEVMAEDTELSGKGQTIISTSSRAITKADLPKLLPLWLTQQCLLEGFVSVPSRAADLLHCAAVRILRCQYGFGIEQDVVDGMDEVRRAGAIGLTDIGLELARICQTERTGCNDEETAENRDTECRSTPPGSLREVLERWPGSPTQARFCLEILHMSMWPLRNEGLLLGMTAGFVCLQDCVAESDLLPEAMKKALRHIIGRERVGLEVCRRERVSSHAKGDEDFTKGYLLAHRAIGDCFE